MTFIKKYVETDPMNQTETIDKTSVYMKVIEKASKLVNSIAAKDVTELMRDRQATDPTLESKYRTTHIRGLKGNWNIIAPKKNKIVSAK